MKTIILGAKGMLGRDLGRVFFDWSPILLDKEELNITDEEAVKTKFAELKPEIVINAAAYTDVDGCETNKELANKVNGEAPGFLAHASKDVGAIFVHYSTDYVFHGDKKEGCGEDDEPGNPINAYGESKFLGEQNVRKAGENYYIIRTSWLFGLNGPNFVETILKKIQNVGGPTPYIKVVNDQHGKPTFTRDLARRTKELLEGDYDFGIYHITNEPATTWYDFAKEIIRQSQNIGGLTPPAGSDPPVLKACSSDEFFHRSVASGEGRPRPARRPEYSILLNTKLLPSRSWQEALGEYLRARK